MRFFWERKVGKRGGSVDIVIPRDLAKALDLQPGDTVRITPDGDRACRVQKVD